MMLSPDYDVTVAAYDTKADCEWVALGMKSHVTNAEMVCILSE